MRCEDFREHLVGRIYGELEPHEEERLSGHLSECPACTEELEGLDRTRGILRASLPDVPAAPRVVLLAPRASRIPMLAVAASLAGIGLLSGLAVAWAWQARGAAEMLAQRATVAAPVQTMPATNGVSREEMEHWFDARMSQMLEDRTTARPASRTGTGSGRTLTKPELDALLTRMEKKLDRNRSADVEYLLNEITAAEARTGLQLGETQQAIRYLALASDPRITEQ